MIATGGGDGEGGTEPLQYVESSNLVKRLQEGGANNRLKRVWRNAVNSVQRSLVGQPTDNTERSKEKKCIQKKLNICVCVCACISKRK